MVATPDTDHLKLQQFESVYPPAEDTYILLDALEQDQQALQGSTVVLEIGSGSGCVSAFSATLLGPTTAAFLCTDLSPTASLCTLQTAARNKVLLNPLTTTLVSSLLPRLANAVDLILFNPPYVVTDPLEVLEAQDLVARAEQVEGGRGREIEGIDKAWAGGADGMEVTDLLLPFVPQLLSPRGAFYLVAIPANKIDDIIARMRVHGLQGEVVLKRRAGREHLHVIRFRWGTL